MNAFNDDGLQCEWCGKSENDLKPFKDTFTKVEYKICKECYEKAENLTCRKCGDILDTFSSKGLCMACTQEESAEHWRTDADILNGLSDEFDKIPDDAKNMTEESFERWTSNRMSGKVTKAERKHARRIWIKYRILDKNGWTNDNLTPEVLDIISKMVDTHTNKILKDELGYHIIHYPKLVDGEKRTVPKEKNIIAFEGEILVVKE